MPNCPPIATTACEDGTVDVQAIDFYPDGLPFMCFSGVPYYIEYGQFAGEFPFTQTELTTSKAIQNTIVACSHLLDEDDGKYYPTFNYY